MSIKIATKLGIGGLSVAAAVTGSYFIYAAVARESEKWSPEVLAKKCDELWKEQVEKMAETEENREKLKEELREQWCKNKTS